MINIHHAGSAVKTERADLNLPSISEPYDPLRGASIVEWFKYYDRIANKKIVQAAGYSNGIACSDRTRAGKNHEQNGFNIRDNLLTALDAKGYHTFLIRITWKRSGRLIHYVTPIHAIYEFGTQQERYDGLQWHLPIGHWSIDGSDPTGPEPEPEPVAEQAVLFDFAEPRRRGVAY